MKFFYRCRGAISVFLSLILLPTVIFGGMVTDAARIYGSEGMISEAGELAMNAGLSQYDSELKDAYGLLVMSKSPEDMSDALEKYFINTIQASNLAGAEDITSLIDLECESFQAYGVDGSQIYQTEAERQQILEYMKYRAPVCLGEELYDKLNEMKETKKQVEAMESQMDFAESMEGLQEACEEANTALKKYCDDVEDSLVVNSTTVNSALGQAEDSYEEATKYLFMLDVADDYSTKGQGDSSEDIFESIAQFNSAAAELSGYTADTVGAYFSKYLTCLYYKKNIPDSSVIEQKISAASEEEKADMQAKYERYSSYARGIVNQYYNALKNKAKQELQTGQQVVGNMYAAVNTGITDAQRALEKLERLHRELENAQGKYASWEGKIEQLEDGELKTNMESDADGYENLLDEEAYQRLYRNLGENKQNLEAMKKHMEMSTFCGISLTQAISDGSMNTFTGRISSWGFFPSSNTNALNEIKDDTLRFMSANFSKDEVSNAETLHSIKGDDFYKELKEACKTEPESEDSSRYKNTTNSLLGQSTISTSSEGIANLEEDWGSDPLPSDVLSQAGADGNDNDKYVMSGDGGTDKEGRKNAISNAKSTLSGMSDFLDSLARILENNIENIYITEYGIQMFSYYTVDKDANGNKITDKITSLSGDDLTDNALYKSEVEYMLWGNKDAQKNVNNTRLLLYGIRMVFNLVYAFTDGKIAELSSTMATAMSCGVAFLVPVFTILIKVAVAGAETVVDVETLMAGKSVALVKKAGNSQIRSVLGLSDGGGSSGIEMNYKEYVTLFLLVRTFGQAESKTLARIADCIQLNTDMNIIEGYTMLSVNAEVKSRTTFLKMAAELPDSGVSGVVDDWYTISYQSVLGY